MDYNSNLLAIAKIPNDKTMRLSGYIFSKDYMFSNEELDNTLHLFYKDSFSEKINEITKNHNLEQDALGHIYPPRIQA